MFKGTVECPHGRKVTLKELSLDTMADQLHLWDSVYLLELFLFLKHYFKEELKELL